MSSQVLPVTKYFSTFQLTEKCAQQLPKRCQTWDEYQVDLFQDIIHVGVVYNLGNSLNFIRCFTSDFYNFWTKQIHHNTRFSADDDIDNSSIIGVSYKIISTEHMNEFSNEVKHTNVAIDYYSYNNNYNTQLDDCHPHEL